MSTFDDMMAGYAIHNHQDRLNATHEVMQQVALAGLARGGFFEKAAFYGGTCLRIFHGLPRFSEDMDFSLLATDTDFRLEPYFDAIRDAFAEIGQQVSLREKHNESPIRKAFLKNNTALYDLQLGRDQKSSISIKIEVDTTPPLQFETETRLLFLPFSCMVKCFTRPCLFAGKMHALLFRAWKNRVKGRDWFDFEWYVRHGIPLDFRHFCERARQSHPENETVLSLEGFRSLLSEKIRALNINDVRDEVRPFLRDTRCMDIWSNEYFQELARNMTLC